MTSKTWSIPFSGNKIFWFVFLLTYSISSIAQTQLYHKVRIYHGETGFLNLQKLGIPVDHGVQKKNYWFETDLSNDDIQKLQQENIPYEILIEDIAEFYEKRQHQTHQRNTRNSSCENLEIFQTPANFVLGSMGGFYTYQEFLDQLDTMFLKYPNLISQKDTIDSFLSHELRPIYWLKISNNPTVDQNKPKILYNALHHAREAASLSQIIMYMYYLLENYGINEEVTYLVDHTEMYFVPMINPDGYYRNQTTNPNGGGMWRKNRRDNGDGTFGVDLNRNYGYAFAYDNNGSSPNTNSDTYRGPSAFSEPETQAIKWLCEHINFDVALNYHTYGDLLIYPWGHKASYYTPDSATFVDFAKILTVQNNYNYGTGDQTVGYVVNGDSDDWMYGEQATKNKILSFTPEAGNANDGFWPTISRIEPISKENIRQNLNLAHLVLNYGELTDLSSKTITEQKNFIPFSIKKHGLSPSVDFTVVLAAIHSGVTVNNASIDFINLNNEAQIDTFFLSFDNTVEIGQQLTFILSVDNGSYIRQDTLHKIYGNEVLLLDDNFSDMTQWSSSSWGITSDDYVSPSHSLTDSPLGNYPNNANNEIVLTNEIDLTNAVFGSIEYFAKWSIEPGYDYVQILASSNGGNSWLPLCGKYTKTGNANQDEGNPVYDGFQTNWVAESIDLTDFIGEKITIKLILKSDVWVNYDGFYIDDFTVKIIEKTNSIQNIHTLPKFNLYPNPTENNFSVVLTNIADALPTNLIITNLLGELVYSREIKTRSEISINQLPSGIYMVCVSNKNGSMVKKLVVK
jgi:carboxypeptidase T